MPKATAAPEAKAEEPAPEDAEAQAAAEELSALQAELRELQRVRTVILHEVAEPDAWLWQKLAVLIANLPPVTKDGRFLDRQGKERYKFTSQAQVMSLLGRRMAAIGLVTVPEITEHHVRVEKEDDGGEGANHVTLKMREWLVDVDSRQRVPFDWFGEAADWGDKATQKAGTIGDKYFLMKLFKLTDFRDPDAENPAEEAQDRPRRSTSREAEQSTSPAVQKRHEELNALNELAAQIGLQPNGERKRLASPWFPAKVQARLKFHSKTSAQFDSMTDEQWLTGIGALTEELYSEHTKFCAHAEGEHCAHVAAWKSTWDRIHGHAPQPEVPRVDPAQDSGSQEPSA